MPSLLGTLDLEDVEAELGKAALNRAKRALLLSDDLSLLG